MTLKRSPIRPPFGYRPALEVDGETQFGFDEEQAAIVRQIFDAAAAGLSAKDIAADLNRSGVPRACK